MALPVDYRKTRGSKGVHTEDEHVPMGKKDQARKSTFRDLVAAMQSNDRRAPKSQGKHSTGHEGQKHGALSREGVEWGEGN